MGRRRGTGGAGRAERLQLIGAVPVTPVAEGRHAPAQRCKLRFHNRRCTSVAVGKASRIRQGRPWLTSCQGDASRAPVTVSPTVEWALLFLCSCHRRRCGARWVSGSAHRAWRPSSGGCARACWPLPAPSQGRRWDLSILSVTGLTTAGPGFAAMIRARRLHPAISAAFNRVEQNFRVEQLFVARDSTRTTMDGSRRVRGASSRLIERHEGAGHMACVGRPPTASIAADRRQQRQRHNHGAGDGRRRHNHGAGVT